ncbi:MAG TPA: glycosyltransferase [Rhodocyclaceae bacterium]|nr:glycosyltransferase [Rhodocyclaceae bacterium]
MNAAIEPAGRFDVAWRMFGSAGARLAPEFRKQRARQRDTWSRGDSFRVLLVTESDPISESQTFPFYYHEDAFRRRWRTEFRETDFSAWEAVPEAMPRGADLILVQAWPNKETSRIARVLAQMRECNRQGRIVFLDAGAPLDLRLAEAVSPWVDRYVKKHVFRDREHYLRPTRGDTNLVEYFNRLYGLEDAPPVQFPIPPGFLDKLLVGPSFVTSRRLLPVFRSAPQPLILDKDVRLHARFAEQGEPWYTRMRRHAMAVCRNFAYASVVSSESVAFRRYLAELMAARICFSPFGYGEVCWRDYEAVMCGALLVKPDMSHVETRPDIFVPYETYVPVAWDLSDLEDTIERYLRDEEARWAIVRRAYRKLHDYCSGEAFIDQFAGVFDG